MDPLGGLGEPGQEAPRPGVAGHDLAVAGGARGGRRVGPEGEERRSPTHLLEPALPPEALGDGDGIERLALVVGGGDGGEDPGVGRAVEVAGGAGGEPGGDR